MLRGSADLGRVAGEELVVTLRDVGMNADLVLSRFFFSFCDLVQHLLVYVMKAPTSADLGKKDL